MSTGRIGRNVVQRAAAFGMRILCHDVAPDAAWAPSTHPWNR